MANENVMINDVELRWARLDTPFKNQFGGENWELQIVAGTDRTEEFAQFGKVKDLGDGMIGLNLTRKAMKKDGSPMEPVRVVDAARTPIENRRGIGNGSRGNVIVWTYDYEFAGKPGKASSLTAVQVTELVEYVAKNTVDFDVLAEEASTEAQPF